MSASGQGLGIAEKTALDCDNYEKWGAVATQEPLSPSLKAEIRVDLIEAWHFKREAGFREKLKIPWLWPADHYQVLLEDDCPEICPHLQDEEQEFTFDKISYHDRFQHYSVTPLYPAIVLIMDRMASSSDVEASTPSDGYIRLEKIAQLQTILMIRTGHDQQLSTPISFDSLRDRSFSLGNPDAVGRDEEGDIIRVSIATVVKFITSLEKREASSAKPFPTRGKKPINPTAGPFPPKGLDRQVCYAPEVWADANLVAAEKHGCDKNLGTWQSVRRVLARREGEDLMQLEQIPFRRTWVP
ncbi:MAG: hypothetical protein Q9173_003601 [Seirophora scorigena]